MRFSQITRIKNIFVVFVFFYVDKKNMLLEFSCANVKSIKDKVTFSLEASSDKSLEDTLITASDKKKYLRFASIYGLNGSGKSSFLTSISLLQELIITNPAVLPGQELEQLPHKSAINEDTEFEIVIIRNGVKYKYALSYNKNGVTKESLFYWPNKRIARIFERENDKYTVQDSFAKLNGIIEDKTFSNRLFLTIAATDTPYQEFKEVVEFFTVDLVCYEPRLNNWLSYSAEQMQNSAEMKQKVLDLLHKMGSDVVDITAKMERVRSAFPAEAGRMFSPALRRSMQIPSIKMHYAEFSLDLSEESDGVQKLIAFLCPIVDMFEKGKIFICDEIERHLHPTIIRDIVEIFMQNKTSDAQIIVTTHDIDLLDLDLLRRDQIWFTRLNKAGRHTDLYSLSSLPAVRKDDNIKKNFLSGKYTEKFYSV